MKTIFYEGAQLFDNEFRILLAFVARKPLSNEAQNSVDDQGSCSKCFLVWSYQNSKTSYTTEKVGFETLLKLVTFCPILPSLLARCGI